MKVLAALVLALTGVSAYAQPSGAAPDVLFQGFHWNAHPGDHATDTGGVWWDSLATITPRLAAAGMQTVWIPSPAKGGGGRWSMGYDPYDFYDLGAIDQKGSVRTRFGTETQLRAAIAAMKASGLRLMADAVLNHRDGADSQSDVACVPGGGAPYLQWNVFNTGSGRFPAGPESFHSNSHHCDYTTPYHDAPFGQDMCYFHNLDGTLGASGAWYNGPHQLGAVGDSLVTWGRWLVDDLGVDEVRLDAIKHIEPGFLAPWIVELASGAQPFALGEFWASTGEIMAYHNEVEAFNSTYGSGGADAQMAMFDFGLRYALRDMANGGGGYDMSGLNSAGLHFSGLDPFSVVTFVENHDVDRIGWVWADCATDPDAVPSGPTTCVKLGIDSGHDPIVSRKNLAYAIVMASEGRPTVFWKDYLWYGLDGEIDWLMALRRLTAQGESAPLASLNPANANAGDFWALRRDGFGSPQYGSVLAVSDGAEEGAWVDSPHSDYELKDYSDAYAFETTRAYTDGRAYVQARGSDYAWWAPTGLYPRPMDEPASSFSLTAEPGGHLHHVVLRAQDAASLTVAGAPIQPGDQVAVLAPEASMSRGTTSGADVAGLGRVGQRLRWDGVHDMTIEVLGNDSGANEAGRLAPGDALRLVVYDASTGTASEAGSVTWGTGDFTYTPLRPASRGGAFTAATSDASGTWASGAVSLVTGFDAGAAPLPREVHVEAIPYRPAPPIELAPGQNTLRFKTRTRNTTRDARTETIWTEVLDAEGQTVATNFSPTPISFSGRETLKNRLTQKVPSSTPAGSYTVHVYIGQYPDAPQDVDSFSFSYGGPPAVASGDETWSLSLVTEPDEGLEAAPEAVRVWPLAPNPFQDRAELRFSLPEAQPIRVELLDARGRRVAVLYSGTPQATGDLRVRIDGRDLPAGVYLVRLSGDGVSATQTVIRAQ